MSEASVELLVYETAYRRLQTAIDARVTALVMDDDGEVRRNGEILDKRNVSPQIAWANRDLYNHGPVRDFMIACLKSATLEWLQSSAAGFEHPVFGKLVGNGVTLTNANASAVPIAEFVMAQVLSAFHPNEQRLANQQARRWEILDFRDVHGSTWLIYGLGHIGAEVATRAGAFGAKVIGCRRTPRGDEPVDEMISGSELLAILPRADVVVMTASLNASNKHIVDARFLGALPEGAIFVNVGRGGLVDEQALLAGLDKGTPARAILDVFETEPLPEDSPLWGHPRAQLSAHCAGASPATSRRGDEIFLDNLARFVAGQPLQMQVSNLSEVGVGPA